MANVDEKIEVSDYDKLRFALDAAGIGTWDLNPITQTVIWDERCRELFGFVPNEIVQYNEVLRYMDAEDAAMVHAEVQKALDPTTQSPYEVRYRLTGANGTKRWLLSKGKAYFNNEGNVYRFAGTAQDITDLMVEREKVIASEKKAEIALDNSNSGYFHVMLTTDEIEYSEGYMRVLTGNPAAVLTRKEMVRYLHPDDLIIRIRAYEVADVTGKLDYLLRVIWDDGSIHWMRVLGTILNDAFGKPQVLTGTVHDVTAEHTQRSVTQQAQELISNAFATTATGMIFTDTDGVITQSNDAFASLLGYTMQELVGINYVTITHEEDLPGCIILFTELVNRQRKHFNIIKRFLHKQGHEVWTQVNVTYVPKGEGRGEVLAIVQDITSDIKRESDLAESETRFRGLIEQAPIATCLFVGKEMQVEIANELMINIWGKGRSVIGKPFVEGLPEMKGQPFLDILDHVYTTGETYEGKAMPADIVVNGVLNTYYYDFTYKAIRNAQGEIYAVTDMAIDVTAEVEGRKALQESEARFRGLIEQAPIATCLYVGREMRIDIANDMMIGIWGKGRSVMAKPIKEALPELEGQPFYQLLDDVYTTGVTFEAKAMRADMIVDGAMKIAYFDFTYKAVHDSNGEIYGVTNMAVDVTEQVVAQKALEESELFSRSIFQTSPIAKMVFVGEKMVIRTVNSKMLDMLGRDDSVVGKAFMDAVPEFRQLPLMDRLLNVYRTGETYYQPEEKVTLNRYGEPYTGYYNYIYKALRNVNGEIYGVMITAVEITEQVLARQNIEIAGATLRGAIELAELGTWELDIANRVLDYSPRLREWFGIDNDEVIGVERGYELIREDYRDQVREGILGAINGGSDGVYDLEYYVNPAISGTERILHAQGKTFCNEQGIPYKISGTVQDVTVQRKVQIALEREVELRTEALQQVVAELNDSNEQLVRSNEELAQYAYVASHDLQEPLRKISIFADMLKEQQTAKGTTNPLLDKITQATLRMSLLIKDLLEFSRLINSDSYVQSVDLNTVLNNLATDFELVVEEKNATVLVDQLPNIEAVGLQMNQLFYNLMNNALKFTKPDETPVIKITSTLADTADVAAHIIKPIAGVRYHHIVFSDNGIGFDMEHAEKIFEIFRRLHGKSVYAGSGIGLALCKRIVVNHNGALYAESSPGNGASFHIILPERQA